MPFDFSQFHFDPWLGGYTRKVQNFPEQAERAGLKPGTGEYAAVRQKYLEQSGFFPWAARANLAKAAIEASDAREQVQRTQRLNIGLASEGMGAYAQAQADAFKQMLPAQKDLARYQNDLTMQQITANVIGQSQIADKNIAGMLESAKLSGNFGLRQTRLGIESGERINLQNIQSRERLGFEDLRSRERQNAISIALQRELMQQQRESGRANRQLQTRGQNLDFISQNRASGTNLISNAINRRFY